MNVYNMQEFLEILKNVSYTRLWPVKMIMQNGGRT